MLRTESRRDIEDDSWQPLFAVAVVSIAMATIITVTWIAVGMLLVGS